MRGQHVYVAIMSHMYEDMYEIVGVYVTYNQAAGDLAKRFPSFVTLERTSDEVEGWWSWEDNFAQQVMRVHRERIQ